MISELLIRDLGIIDEVSLELAPGLNVLTGETGAGKTMVVSAIELLLGARADTDRVRPGASAAIVEGRLRPPPAEAADWLEEGDDELVVAREVGTERSRARIGGRLAPASALAAAVGAAVEVHGQSDTSGLSSPVTQRVLLDRFGGDPVAAAAAAYAEVFARWQASAEELSVLRSDDREQARQADRLRFELAEIDSVGPEPGEEQALESALARLEHTETLIEAATRAAGAIVVDGGARETLGTAVAALREATGLDEALDKLAARVDGVAAEAQDIAVELRVYADSVELDPDRLEQLRERRGALASLTRKYGPDTEAVVAYAADLRTRLAGLEGSAQRAEQLERDVVELERRTRAAAARLTDARSAAAGRLAAAVDEHLAELAMAAAAMTVRLQPTDPGPHGADRVELLLAANAGQPALPLGKAASGGERSRVALAVRLALADADDTSVLVFDEIDAGIGGQVARAVGSKLARLARGRQVLCVTHLAQLAAYADAHFVVSKHDRDGHTHAGVARLDEGARAAELARMLSGDPDSPAAMATAEELRAAARADPTGPGGRPPGQG